MKKKLLLFVAALFAPMALLSQGWPADYGGVVLQGFFWDSFRPADGMNNQTMATLYGAGWGEGDEWYVPVTNWVELLNQKDNIAPFIDLLWLPQSGATVCSDKSVFTTEWEAWRAGHNGSWVCTHYGDTINNPDCMGFVPVFYLDHGRGQTYEINGRTWQPKSYFGTETELINLISAYKAAGTGAMEDVVANHKGGLSTWDEGVQYAADFVDEINVVGPTTGRTYSIRWEWDENGKCKDICWDDECGMGSGNGDCGGDAGKGPWARDLDHHSPATQQKILTYLRYLKDEIGYVGFRYDYARGFEPKHFAYYNTTVRPTFSVGEFWGTADEIKSWIKGVYDEGGFQSGAFDFPLQEQIRQAFNDQSGQSFRKLKNDGLIWDYRFKRYAVTFIDNHDTFKDLPTDASNSNYQHRVNYQLVEANCFILSMPGTPCLFYPHFMNPAWHDIIARFIKARRTAGVTNESTAWDPVETGSYGISWRVTGENGDLYLQLGSEAVGEGVPEGFTEVWCNTQNTCRLSITSSLADQVDSNVKRDLVYGYPVISKNSGNYNAPVEVNVKPSTEGTVLVYTTDGKAPNAYSKQITDAEGMDFSFNCTTTLKVGVLANGEVRSNSIVTREYVVDSEDSDENIMVYVKYDGGDLPWIYAFDDGGNSLTGNFPGWQYSYDNHVVIGGVTWLHAMVNASRINLILSYGNDASKTADINGVTNDVFFSFADGVAHDLTATYTQALHNPIVSIDLASGEYDHAISPRLTASNSNAVIVYTTDGSEPTPNNGRQMATYEGTVTFDTEGSHVLRAGVLNNGSVINQVARTYYVTGTSASGVNIYVSAEEDPYVYAWEEISGENIAPVAWPGTKLTEKNEQGWYHYSQDAPSLNIIIHNGNGGQTQTISGLTPGDHYFNYDGGSGYSVVQTDLPSCAAGMGDDVFYCYFENSAHYADPFIWITNKTSIYTGSSWPGEALGSPVGVAPNGNLIYCWVYNGDITTLPANVIFSDNGNQTTQTSDFAFVNGGYYNANGLMGVVNSNVMTLADIVSKGEVGKEYVIANDLTSVWMNDQDQWLWVKDNNGDAVDPSYNTHFLPVPDATSGVEYDQSNWAQLILKEPVTSGDEDILGRLLLGQTVIGTLVDRENPTIELRVNPIPAASAPYTPNTFVPANFVEQESYFMVEPKAQEYVNIAGAICREKLNDSTFVMVMPKSNGDVNSENLPGAFLATVKQGYWEDMSTFDPATSIRVNREYTTMTGIVRAIDRGQWIGLAPDDAEHSPVSDQWELYIISATEAPLTYIRGDVDGNMLVDINDVSVLIDILLYGDDAPEAADCDLNFDVDINDVTALIDFLLYGNWGDE